MTLVQECATRRGKVLGSIIADIIFRRPQAVPIRGRFYPAGINRNQFRAYGDYSAWPGPNSNTFIQAILDAVPELNAVLPPTVERLRVDVPEDKKLLSIFTDVFDCFFRFLAANLAAEGILQEDDSWRTVAEVTRDYQHSVPELADKFKQYDMFAPEFALSCLNRLQLRNNRQMEVGQSYGLRSARRSNSKRAVSSL